MLAAGALESDNPILDLSVMLLHSLVVSIQVDAPHRRRKLERTAKVDGQGIYRKIFILNDWTICHAVSCFCNSKENHAPVLEYSKLYCSMIIWQI